MSTPKVERGWAAAAVRIGFGVIWAIDAWLKWQPGFRATFLPNIIIASEGQPHWLAPWFDFCIRMQRPAPEMWAYAAAVIETLIAITVISGAGRRVVYIGGALYSLLIWSSAEGFGGPYGRGATDVGPSIIYVLVFLALLVMLEHGLDRFNVDSAIARRIPWWAHVAGPGPMVTA